MSTVIYPSPIFGPIKSRRLGISLGINLLPGDGKVCTFDCIYCECGLNAQRKPQSKFPTRQQVAEALQQKLEQMKVEGISPDVLTFAGNGEPTAHPDFAAIIDDTLALRNLHFPHAKVSVLTNATRINKKDVFEALKKVDNNIVKLDTVSIDYIARVDRPVGNYNLAELIDYMRAFDGQCVIQTMFMKGTDADGHSVDNTGDVAFYKDIADSSRTEQTTRFAEKEYTLSLGSLNVSYEFDEKTCKSMHVRNLRTGINFTDILRLSSVKIERGTDYLYSQGFEFYLNVTL